MVPEAPFSEGSMMIHFGETYFWCEIADGPKIEEDIRSLNESSPFFIMRDAEPAPITCECCGTLVVLLQESDCIKGPWKPGIWEHVSRRKHTLRRCNWMRDSDEHTYTGRAADYPSVDIGDTRIPAALEDLGCAGNPAGVRSHLP